MKPRFQIGIVIAFRRAGEVLFRYGRVHADLGTMYNYQGLPEHGWRVIDGNKFYSVPDSAMRPLTARECGPRTRRRK